MEYSSYIISEVDNAWIDTCIEEKRGDELHLQRQLIALESDINDRESVIAEHMLINGEKSKYLKYGVIQIEGKYYFFNVAHNAMELKTLVDNNMFICPYCKCDLCIVSSYERTINNKKVNVDAFLRHYSGDSSAKNCIFHNNSEAEENRMKLYSGEGIKHKQLKIRVIKAAKQLKFELPLEYKIENDKENYESRAIFTKTVVKKVINVESEKKVLNKDNITKGYVPDIILHTEDKDEIYVEVTVTSGKMVSDYYDIWKRTNKTILECKLKDGDIYFRYLYNPVRDKARKAVIINSKALADKKKNDIMYKIDAIISSVEKELIKKYNMKKQYIGGKNILVTSKGKLCEYKWKHIVFGNIIINRKQPEVIWKRLKMRGFMIVEGYNNSLL